MSNSSINRQEFIRISSKTAAAGVSAAIIGSRSALAQNPKPVRIGMVAVGGRGRGLLSTLLVMKDVQFPALCDINANNLAEAQSMVEKAGFPKPEGYAQGPEDYKRLMEREDLDAVIIASPWDLHTPMALYGMRCGKYTAVEVPAAITLEQCWDLVNMHEQTKVPCMMLENWCFRQDNLAVLNMIREGLFGETVHAHCAYSHDCIDHWYFDRQGNARWGADFLVKRNTSQYPTHGLGPVISWLNLGCGDYFDYITSTATDQRGITDYFKRKFGPEHPNARRQYAQGDIVTTVIRTKKGKTIVHNYDMQLHRPYDNRWMIQGTMGIYNEARAAVYLQDVSPEYHQWESFAPYQQKYEHSWWKALQNADTSLGHQGTDYLELQQFLKAVREKTQTPVDVYDSVLMSCIVALAEQSIAGRSARVDCPDFTRGRWKTKKPAFALQE